MLGVVRVIATLASAAVIGFGIPAVWFWVAGQIQAGAGSEGTAFTAVLVAFVGVAGSYIGLIGLVGAGFAQRLLSDGEEAPVRHANWNRSLSAERKQAPALNPLETVFVVTALLVGCAYMVWFFVFAGSSIS
jgi:multisubunit Na+/H+ antiporter MnhC subunit